MDLRSIVSTAVLTASLILPFNYFGKGPNPDLQLQPHEKEIKGEQELTLFFQVFLASPVGDIVKFIFNIYPVVLENTIFEKSTVSNQTDELFWLDEFTALSLDKVFFILLIHSCGEGMVSTALYIITSAGSLLMAAVPLTACVYVSNRMQKGKLERETKRHIREYFNKDKELEDMRTTLMDVKRELENHGYKTKQFLEEVEHDRENNKKKLLDLENDIIAGEATFDKPEELLRKKENLLQDQWKLDKTKKTIERHLLNLERQMESIETKTAGKKILLEAEHGN